MKRKSFKELAKEMSPLKEDQLGKLKGGFSSFSLEVQGARVDDNNNNTNNASSCSCSCNSGCSGRRMR